MSDLRKLAQPFDDKYVHSNPSGGGTYVKHHVIVQRLLMVVGAYDYQVVAYIRGDVPAIPPNPDGNSKRAKEGSPALHDVIVGATCRLTVDVDGRSTTVEDAGDCEQPHNWPHDGARAKDAVSDAIKRCAARIGLGLHLWSQDEYFLASALAALEDRNSNDSSGGVGDHAGEAPPEGTPDPQREGEAPHPDGWDVPPPSDNGGPWDWQQAARDAGAGPVEVLKQLISDWPNEDQAARPNRIGDVDALVEAGQRDKVEAAIAAVGGSA